MVVSIPSMLGFSTMPGRRPVRSPASNCGCGATRSLRMSSPVLRVGFDEEVAGDVEVVRQRRLKLSLHARHHATLRVGPRHRDEDHARQRVRRVDDEVAHLANGVAHLSKQVAPELLLHAAGTRDLVDAALLHLRERVDDHALERVLAACEPLIRHADGREVTDVHDARVPRPIGHWRLLSCRVPRLLARASEA